MRATKEVERKNGKDTEDLRHRVRARAHAEASRTANNGLAEAATRSNEL
jgi:hypothetical protein